MDVAAAYLVHTGRPDKFKVGKLKVVLNGAQVIAAALRKQEPSWVARRGVVRVRLSLRLLLLLYPLLHLLLQVQAPEDAASKYILNTETQVWHQACSKHVARGPCMRAEGSRRSAATSPTKAEGWAAVCRNQAGSSEHGQIQWGGHAHPRAGGDPTPLRISRLPHRVASSLPTPYLKQHGR